MEKQLVVGRTYAVTTSSTCNVTDANGTLITSASAGQQVVFVAPTTTVTFSDDSASVVAVFKLALAKTRLFEQLGGGGLPTGYLPALFLEFTGSQWVNSGFYADQNSAFSAVVSANNFNVSMLCGSRTAYGTADSFGFAVRDSTQAFLLFDGNTSSVANSELMPKILSRTEITLDSTGCRFDGVTFSSFSSFEEFATPVPLYVGTVKNVDGVDARGWKGKVYNFKLSRSGVLEQSFVPAISPDGLPCLFDNVKKLAVGNVGSGAFYVGMTTAQARKLGNLPANAPNKNLTISLPSAIVSGETVTDSEVAAALATARAKQWRITVQTY